jgi:hypothetical protein
VSVSVLVPAAVPLRLAGEKEAVTPVRRPEAVKFTVELKPPDGVTETGTLAFPPMLTVADPAEEVSANEGVVTVRLRVAVFVRPPPVAIIVTG